MSVPTYVIQAREERRWLARIVGASDDAPRAPLGQVTEAATQVGIIDAARDLIATVLDTVDDDAFNVRIDFVAIDPRAEW